MSSNVGSQTRWDNQLGVFRTSPGDNSNQSRVAQTAALVHFSRIIGFVFWISTCFDLIFRLIISLLQFSVLEFLSQIFIHFFSQFFAFTFLSQYFLLRILCFFKFFIFQVFFS